MGLKSEPAMKPIPSELVAWPLNKKRGSVAAAAPCLHLPKLFRTINYDGSRDRARSDARDQG